MSLAKQKNNIALASLLSAMLMSFGSLAQAQSQPDDEFYEIRRQQLDSEELRAAREKSVEEGAAGELYEIGQRQLDNKEFRAAQETFSEIVHIDESRRDAALYWLAYAQFRNRLTRDALATIEDLSEGHPDSPWLDDAQALKVEIQDKSGESFDVDKEELKLYALNSLMNSPSEKSVDVLAKLLSNRNTDRIKKRALFILSQIDDIRSYELIAQIARENSNRELQKQAINVLGISGSLKAMSSLREIYNATDSDEAKVQILNSYMLANQGQLLVDLARNESNKDLQRQAIRLVGLMSQSAALVEMYYDPSFEEFRKEIINGIALGGDADALAKIIESEQDEEMQVYAIEKMGLHSGVKSSDKLINIYQQNDDEKVRGAVIKALFIQSNSAALIDIVQKESNPELKRDALQKLSMMGSDESIEYFNNILQDDG